MYNKMAEEEKFDEEIKVLVLGDNSVGIGTD